MLKIRDLVNLFIVGMLLVSGCKIQPPATNLETSSRHEPTREIDPELLAALDECANILPGQACLVEGPVHVTAQPEGDLMPFQEPGQVINLADLQTMKLGGAGSTKGLVVMRIQTEWPGGAFTAMAFGDVELVNEVPYGTLEFNPMQSLKLATGPNTEGKLPTSGIFVSSPEDGNLSTLVVNGAELSFGSTALLTSLGGGLTIQTVSGVVGVWLIDKFVEVIQGSRLDLAEQEIEQQALNRYPEYDPAYETVKRALDKYAEAEFWREYWERMNREDPAWKTVHDALEKYHSSQNIPEEDPAWKTVDAALKRYRAAEELRRKQKRWKGGWWKMTYGPVTVSGQCQNEVAGDGGDGGDGEPYTMEIPICRGNNGNTILMYESGVSYDRIGPNMFSQSSVTEFDLYGDGKLTAEGQFTTLQVVSPTRMILANARTENDSCTTASVAYLDFVRDDPNVRCDEIIYIDPFTTPTPAPQTVAPPVEGQYQVRLGMLANACDPAARPFAPSFTTAALSLSLENKLVIDAVSTKYELELSNLIYPYFSMEMDGEQYRLGIFSLEQPVDSSFNLMMTLVQMPSQQWTGNWLVASQDATQFCGGSIDLLPPD